MNLLASIQVARVSESGVAGSYGDAFTVGAVVTGVAVVLALLMQSGKSEPPSERPELGEEYEEEEEVRAQLAKLS